MISRLRVQNFKCLRDIDVSLGALTILIGPNDSGKSSILDALQLLGRTTWEAVGQVFAGPLSLENLVWMKDIRRNPAWAVEGSTGGTEFAYSLSLSPLQGEIVQEYLRYGGADVLVVTRPEPGAALLATLALEGERQAQPYQAMIHGQGQTALALFHNQPYGDHRVLTVVCRALISTGKCQLDTAALRRPCAIAPRPILAADGSNLVAVLDAIASAPDRSDITALEKNIRENIPTLRGIHLPATETQGVKTLEFTLAFDKGRTTIPADLASDGAVLLTAFLALAYGETPDLILIEEPENGIHYSLLGKVVDLLRRISTGEIGSRPRQVIVTTHSPLLLNFARPEEVRVCQRTADGATTVTPMDKVPDLDKLLKEFAPGELWYLMGEEKIVQEARS
jgi:predicted ATPase